MIVVDANGLSPFKGLKVLQLDGLWGARFSAIFEDGLFAYKGTLL